jgi:hypothetical protein
MPWRPKAVPKRTSEVIDLYNELIRANMTKLNVAIVGLGFGTEFIPIYQRHPNANMYAICQRHEDKLNQIGDAFGVKVRYNSFEKLLEDPQVDIVHINSPIHEHAPMSVAVWAGKHVASTVPWRPRLRSAGNRRGARRLEEIHDDGNGDLFARISVCKRAA